MNGTYGIKKPALITSEDIDIFYHYRRNRASDSTDFPSYRRLDSGLLAPVNGETSNGISTSVLPGMYDLRLPISTFNNVGIYTIYIKPKEIYGTITDVSTLAAYPNVRGIVLNISDFDGMPVYEPNGLVGYRVEYFDNSGNRKDMYRVITSSNKCEPVSQNMTNSSQKGIRYRFNDSSNLIFCTLIPNAAMSFKSTSTPYIGSSTERIALVNTKFNPVVLEVEMTQHDIDTVSTMLEGSQIRNLDAGLITTFNENGEIYHQASYANITNGDEDIHHDVKLKGDGVINFDERNKFEKILNNF